VTSDAEHYYRGGKTSTGVCTEQEYQKNAELGSRRATVIAVLSCQINVGWKTRGHHWQCEGPSANRWLPQRWPPSSDQLEEVPDQDDVILVLWYGNSRRCHPSNPCCHVSIFYIVSLSVPVSRLTPSGVTYCLAKALEINTNASPTSTVRIIAKSPFETLATDAASRPLSCSLTSDL
jgi:hypothetical protein